MQPKHQKSEHFASSDFFRGIKSFRELEEKIANLPDTKVKGDAFEVFAEAYWMTQKNREVDEVWPLQAAPKNLTDDLSLPVEDYGVDGIFKDNMGQLCVYQVKFRSNRKGLSWRELSTFMGLTDSPKLYQRVLITNTNELPSVMNQRKGFYCIRGTDFERLGESDFYEIEQWLDGNHTQALRKSPLPHQIEALDSLIPALEQNDRATAVMACGTGKTLLAMWTAEELNAQSILILVPSLALLRQTLHEWHKESNLSSMAYICVCSDPSVKEGVDSIRTLQSDLDFPVNTRPENLRSFLDAPFDGVKIVYCTYQSIDVISRSMQAGDCFDFAVFDEAHKTAGQSGKWFSAGLDDTKVSIKKRLFMTATPRRFKPKRNTDGELNRIYSMDNEDLYGPVAYRLTFAEAAEREIICPYKVIISVITNEMINNEMLEQGKTLVDDEEVETKAVANQIALSKAVEKYRPGKIFTFHRTVSEAEQFTGSSAEGIRRQLPDYSTHHVNGQMSTSHRESVMNSFKASAKAIMSNARCLTEGVDVPSVEMVAFMSPKRSRVDIVQATGRAMRKAPGKVSGFVLVPIYVELEVGETIDEAVTRADFDDVWEVLQAMQDQDEALEILLQEMAIIEGSGNRNKRDPFHDVLELVGPLVDLNKIKQAVGTQVVASIVPSWFENYGKLKSFYSENGTTEIPSNASNLRSLYSWCLRQRSLNAKGSLSKRRRSLLDELGFRWERPSVSMASPEQRLQELIEFRREWGHFNIPRSSHRQLKRWVKDQRRMNRQGKLNPDLKKKLDDIGFEWKEGILDKAARTTTRIINELKEFKKEHGHCRVNVKTRLGEWLRVKKKNKREGNLNPVVEKELDQLGVDWEPSQNQYVISGLRLEQLDEFRKEHGHCRVPRRYMLNLQLGEWVRDARRRQREDRMSVEMYVALDQLGFWDDPE